MSFANNYTHRKVAETSAKSCDICFKPTSSVLVAPENKDFFYICPAHLKDRHFCTPIIDHAAVEARKKKEMDEEIARVKREYEEKQKKKKQENEKEKDAKDKDKDKKDEADNKGDKDVEKKVEDKTGDKASGLTATEGATPPTEEEPRIFELKKPFFQQRIDKRRQFEMAKRNRERLQQASFFPSVPKSLPQQRPGAGQG